MSDKVFSNMTERELMIQQAGVLKKLCGSLKDLKEDNTADHEKLFDKVDKTVVEKISNKLFFWIVGILVLCMISMTTVLGTINTQVTTNTTRVDNIEANIDRIHRSTP